ncbi:MAG: hypothetical protein A2W31_14680 [Planctomycetes bacterium RBG_16_64_10]|nr:MAG: hypothetical protein A2W31_14680 [Planctomycetes bacterium RBG_16_64_10]
MMVFALLVVLLAVTTYVGFKQYGDARTENATLAQAKNQLQEGVRATQEEANRYKEKMMGFSFDDQLAKVQEGFQQDMQKYAANFPEEKQVYRAVLEYLYNEVKSISEREAAARDREQQLKDQLAQVQDQASKQIQEYQKQSQQFEQDKAAEAAKFDQERAQFVKQTDQVNKQLEEKRKEIADLQAAKDTQNTQLQDKIGKLENQLYRVSTELADLRKGSFEVADGEVVRVNQGSDTVWINLGRNDGLTPRVMFSVYDAVENNATTAAKKAGIEVTRILGRSLAEARIVSDTVSNPIVGGDRIYSPVWHRGRAESFALNGLIDIDGDGKSDLDRVRDLIEINGGVIDAEIGDDGAISGTLTVNTRYLVRGEQPKVGSDASQDAAGVKKAIETFSEMNRQAADLGVEVINVAEFLDRMGWRPADRTVRLGRGASPDDFRAEPAPGAGHGTTVAPTERFRRRRPPDITY